MDAIVQNYYGTTQEWEEENPILFEGVLGIEKTKAGTRLIKIGDGKNPWNDLDYSTLSNDRGLRKKIKNLERKITLLENQNKLPEETDPAEPAEPGIEDEIEEIEPGDEIDPDENDNEPEEQEGEGD